MKAILLFLAVFSLKCGFCQSKQKDSVYVFYFKSAKAVQPIDSIQKFKKFYKKFESCATCIIELKGYTDSVGGVEANLLLSKKRIEFVKKQLSPIHLKQLEVLPFGEKLSQSSKNDQFYRKVVLKIKAQKTVVLKAADKSNPLTQSPVTNLSYYDSLNTPDKLKKAFEVRNRAIRLNLLFELNSINLVDDVQRDLELLAAYLLENKKLKIKLVGHVCCSNDYELSRGRALQVKRFLIVKGVEANRMSCEGVGNTQPSVKEISPETEAINRRVEVTFYE